jgi:hypothetical protein
MGKTKIIHDDVVQERPNNKDKGNIPPKVAIQKKKNKDEESRTFPVQQRLNNLKRQIKSKSQLHKQKEKEQSDPESENEEEQTMDFEEIPKNINEDEDLESGDDESQTKKKIDYSSGTSRSKQFLNFERQHPQHSSSSVGLKGLNFLWIVSLLLLF